MRPHQSSLASRATANYLQGVDADVPRTARHCTAPYLSSSFTSVADMPRRHRLRSASTDQIDVPFFRRSTVGGRAFTVAGAKVWNSLASDVTSAPSLPVFRNRLKTTYFAAVMILSTYRSPLIWLSCLPVYTGPCDSSTV